MCGSCFKPVMLLLLALILWTAPAQAIDVSIHGRDNCSAPPNPSAGAPTISLSPGLHQVEWLSGGWSLWNSDGFNGGLTWVAAVRARIQATGEEIIIGPGGGFYASLGAVEAVAVGTVTPLNLTVPSDVTFFVTDGGGCGDNRGVITLRVTEPPVAVETLSWGMIRARYGAPR